ncbi:MAG: peptidoglycan DD-metalloendopeptidase family protein [Oscillospiraceae bacterium]|nr:peptidoglycan DD-metalloendopeptidase family protein [Oscillospiraceae bacterium]
MSRKNKSNTDKNGFSLFDIKCFGTIAERATLRRIRSAAIACICLAVIYAASTTASAAYAAWFNGNSELAEMSMASSDGEFKAYGAEEPSGFSSFVTSLSNSKLEYIVYIDGVEAGSVDSIDTLNDVLDELISRYKTDRTVSAEIEQSISTKCVYTESPVFFGADRLSRALDPNNLNSECRLTINTVENYETSYTVPYDTVTIDDPELDEGVTRIVTPGVKGFVVDTLCDTLVNGEVTESRIVRSETLVEKSDEVVISGTKPLTASTGTYIWPADGTLTSYFGYRNVSVGSTYHKGIDIVGQYGQDIWASDGGEVIFAGWMSGYGNFIKIQHDNGEISCYGHCCELLVSEGDRVYQGQVIAHMGSTGTATAVHVHFEIRVENVQVDPLPYLP